jgi:chromosome segregation ATPase
MPNPNTDPESVGIPDAIAAIEDKTLPMSQRLGVALKALQGVDPTGQLATVKADLDTAKTDLSARDGEITQLKADLDAAQKRITALESDVASADQARADAEKTSADLQSKEQDIATRADALAKEKIAALGFNSNQLPPQNTEHQGNDDAGEKSPEARIRKLEGNQRIVAAMHFQKHGKLPDFMNN